MLNYLGDKTGNRVSEMDKSQWRKEIKKVMNELSQAEMKEQSKTVQEKLFTSELWKKADVVGTTISVGNELDTCSIIKQAWEENKRIAAPKCFPENRQLIFYEFSSFEDLEESFYGLKEPIPSKTLKITPEEMELLLVPGLVFDEEGYRIGYGGGYYDRFLEGRDIKTCSLCYDFQLVRKLPHDSFDIPVNYIISPVKAIKK
ncbi:5-formyltetrahydrofolate cyclo-ligase [Evansella clarkii]|uniref:5-formyltetrahydrofolate cyclo-ligase n=1 Tax=Evansella clarkii TaxID=79879 RepID=UPI000B43351C|nr:5-formyltetrahydrofolate cyclo-ligase [Evansella clarkii]